MKICACGVIAAVMVLAVCTSAYANTVTPADEITARTLFKKLVDFDVELGEVNRAQREPTLHSLSITVCLMRVRDQVYFLERQLLPVVFIFQIAEVMINELDEAAALKSAKIALPALATALADARQVAYETQGSCHADALAYDKAKALAVLVDEIEKKISPIRKRVEATKYP